ncbi:GTP-binding protein [Pseudobutyrivibrio xylanivorans]|uniref:GTPase, G3E family n=1 Tax=Pseudobutyrivibrio xylanivorans DSM 14809 TaxID=1123012 RepID=A0A1M6ES98_PSEXY|nr:GTP-binding protein [Pseudobutyrivibrio xylanivorans]SHI88361.1 GTPase, G3E family [Pseudobutyrivibrio xylanivorans DSM 14809]
MIKVDLITGFLGSGKTTFLKKYAKYFMDKGQHIGILENDYGAVNVDMLLLNELRGDNCELEMVAGGCDADCHRRRFKTKLISMGMSGYDRVIIEPSGIFDVDEFFDSLRDEPLDRWYEIGNVITIVDAKLDENLSEDSDFFLASQIANAGVIVLSRSQLTDEKHISATISHLKRAAEKAKLDKDIESIVFSKDWNELSEEDFTKISGSGYSTHSYIKKLGTDDAGYKTLYFLELPMKKDGLKEKIDALMSDPAFGKIFRAKGFFKDNEVWYQFNATKEDFELNQMPVGQEVFIIIGEEINEEKVKDFFEAK